MTTELETWPYDGDPDDSDIVDGEVIDETIEPLPHLPALREPGTVAIPGAPVWARLTSPEAAAAARRGVWATGHFLAVDLPVAIGIGLARWIRGWWRWMFLSKDREAAEANGTWDQKSAKIRQETEQRVKQSFGLLLLLVVAGLTFWWLAPPEYVAAVAAMLLLGLFSTGYQWSQPRETIIATASQMGWAGSFDALREALIHAKVMRPDQDIRPVVYPSQVGAGYLAVFDCPPGLTVTKLNQNKAEIASALAVDSTFMALEKAGHDGRCRMWAAIDDPYRGAVKHLPLLEADRWNAWQPAPFGETPRGQVVPLGLVYSNYLGGGKPGSGKTYTGRVVAAPYILDPRPRIFCANGKGDPAWDAIAQVSVEFISGRRDEDAWAVNAMLDRVIAEMNDRFHNRMTASKVTEDDGIELWLVIVDELQNYTTNPVPTDELVHGKKATLGQLIAYKLTDIVKNGRAAGVVLELLTQKPSDQSLPAELRDQIGTRFANKVMNYHVSNMILGSNLSVLGYDASRISSKHRGLGILVPDADEDVMDGLDLDDYPTVRPYLVDETDWSQLCARGRELRLEAGTLEGRAAGETETPVDDGIDDADVVLSEIPEVLESIFDFVHDRADRDRVAARDLRERFDPDSNDSAFGRQLRRWGCPSGRDGGRGPSGPRVGDVRAAVERMRGGGPIEVDR